MIDLNDVSKNICKSHGLLVGTKHPLSSHISLHFSFIYRCRRWNWNISESSFFSILYMIMYALLVYMRKMSTLQFSRRRQNHLNSMEPRLKWMRKPARLRDSSGRTSTRFLPHLFQIFNTNEDRWIFSKPTTFQTDSFALRTLWTPIPRLDPDAGPRANLVLLDSDGPDRFRWRNPKWIFGSHFCGFEPGKGGASGGTSIDRHGRRLSTADTKASRANECLARGARSTAEHGRSRGKNGRREGEAGEKETVREQRTGGASNLGRVRWALNFGMAPKEARAMGVACEAVSAGSCWWRVARSLAGFPRWVGRRREGFASLVIINRGNWEPRLPIVGRLCSFWFSLRFPPLLQGSFYPSVFCWLFGCLFSLSVEILGDFFFCFEQRGGQVS